MAAIVLSAVSASTALADDAAPLTDAAEASSNNCMDAAAVLAIAGLWRLPFDPEANRLVMQFRDDNERISRQASQRLTELSNGAVPVLAHALFDTNPAMRRWAAHTLAEIGPEAAAALTPLTCRLHDVNAEVRRKVIWAVGRTGSPDAIPFLITALYDPDPLVTRTAARMLSEFGTAARSAIPALADVLLGEQDFPDSAKLGSAVAYALGQMGPEAAPHLIIALRHPNRDVRLAVIAALGNAKPPTALAVPELVAMFSDEYGRNRGYAALVLSEMGNAASSAGPALIALLDDAEEYPRMMAAKALGDIGFATDQAIEALLRRLADTEESVRERAIESLGNLHARADVVVPALTSIVRGGRRQERRAAIEAIGTFGRQGVHGVPALADALTEDSHLAMPAAFALRRVGPSAAPAVPSLVAALSHRDHMVVAEAARALAAIGEAADVVIDALTECLVRGQDKAREDCGLALSKLAKSHPVAVSALISALSDSNFKVRGLAARDLWQVGSSIGDVVAALVNALGDSHEFVRAEAASTLGRLGNVASVALPALQRRLEDDHSEVRDAAARAIAKIAGSTTP